MVDPIMRMASAGGLGNVQDSVTPGWGVGGGLSGANTILGENVPCQLTFRIPKFIDS